MNEKNEFNQPIGKLVENWRPAKRPEPVVMKGEYCSVVPIDIAQHAQKLWANLAIDNRGESWTYLSHGPFADCKEFCAWIQATNHAQQDTNMYVILNKQQEPVGIASYLRIHPEQGVIEVGHLHFSKLLQKTPAATEAMYLMMRYVFEDLGYRRYEWKCHSLNEASRVAAMRLGFQFEGIFRQSSVFKNRNRDTAWFSIIDTEWPALKETFNRWLDKTNFDGQGNQIKRLREV
jgi:RimJ/RimL family protein N-acetyltransferase